MASSAPSILFVSHDASRTGAPIVLLTFLKWFRANTDYDFEVLLGRGGELEQEFAELAPTTTAALTLGQSVRRVSSRLARPQASRSPSRAHQISSESTEPGHRIEVDNQRAQWRRRVSASLPPALASAWQRQWIRVLARRFAGVPLVYSNTLQNGALLRQLTRPDQKVISHVHELEWWLDHFTSPRDLSFTKQVTDHYVACSNVTLENLVEAQSVPRANITLCHSFVAVDEVTGATSLTDRSTTRNRLGIPADALLVGGMGTTDWRKGPDLFVQLAASVTKSLPHTPVYFLWAGGDSMGSTRGSLLVDAKRLGIGDRIKFIGHISKPTEFLAAMDVFALTSREDPFPLVMLEAAALGLPIVCFAGGGGAPEFVEADAGHAGHVSPYLDIADMSRAVVRLLEDDDSRKLTGELAAERVRNRHDVEKAAPVLLDVIRSQLRAQAPRGLNL